MARPRGLLTRRWPEQIEKYLSEHYELTVNASDQPLGAADLQMAVRSFDALCPTVSDRIDADILNVEPRAVRIVANYGAGVSHIDLDTCRRLGVTVTNTPDVLAEATAELTLTLMLMVARRAGEGERLVRAGAWAGWSPTHLVGTQLAAKTLGLVGYGRIAQATARKGYHGFGMPILYFS